MHVRVSLIVAILVLSVAAGSASGATGSAAKGEIGGPPTLQINRFPSFERNKPTSPVLVIGKGKAYDGPVEIVAADSKVGFCTFVEYPRSHDGNGGGCGFEPLPILGRAIEVTGGAGLIYPAGNRYTSIEGPLRPDVASVRVYFHRHGHKQRFQSRGLVAQVSGQLQAALNQEQPFGYFSVKVRGCVATRAFRAEALDASGNVIGSAKFGFGGWRECLDPTSVLPPEALKRPLHRVVRAR